MKSKEEFIREFREKQKQRDKERLAYLRAKYGNMTEEQRDEELRKGIEFQLKCEQDALDQPTAQLPAEPRSEEKPTPTDKIDWDSPKQRRLFGKMGTVYKVEKPDRDDKDKPVE